MRSPSVPADPGLDRAEAVRLAEGRHDEPHRILGAHPDERGGSRGVVVRAFHPEATGAEVVLEGGAAAPLEGVAVRGMFSGFLPGLATPLRYRIRFRFEGGRTWERDDPYRFLPTVGETDVYLFHEGTHRRLWEVLGARPAQIDGVDGTAFAVWAPNAARVSVVGDFCRWDGRLYPMRRMRGAGIFELFLPGVAAGALYKFEIRTREGMLRLKADPMALAAEMAPRSASRVYASSYAWGDDAWMADRPARDPAHEPMAVYEVHLGSWARVPEEGGRPLSYREIAPRLVDHVKRFGFTHVELLPVAEHPYGGSWGYQVTGYFAPTSRYGTPDDFRFFVDTCHQSGVGVLVDWVPAHFPKDDWALRRFDGTALYEHDDPRLGEHPDWGTLIFNYGRSEVRSFLIANALYWLEEFHVDGLRVDAVASMLYLDYSRKEGEWIPNRHGGRENLDAIDFLRTLTTVVREVEPGALVIAEESTSWPRVTGSVAEGGLGFHLKWNMGWMHDTLKYFETDPIGRFHVHDKITFAMLYEYSERFVNPLSHDEVVHGKRSLLSKMPGDAWRQFANLRALLGYMWTRPGKKLLFMGSEIAPWIEWNYETSLDWASASDAPRAGIQRFLEDLGRLYRGRPCLWRRDHEPEGFAWIDCSDRKNSVISYVRSDGDDRILVALNLTPLTHEAYRIGAPAPGRYDLLLSSDDATYGGSGFDVPAALATEPEPLHGHAQSLLLRLPPLAMLVLDVPASPASPPPAARKASGARRPSARRPR